MALWILTLDYILGIVMWTLIGRSAMNIFQREDSDFFFMKVFVKFTNPLLRLFDPITPSFLLRPMVPLYVAWFFYLMGMLSFPLESDISKELYSIYTQWTK